MDTQYDRENDPLTDEGGDYDLSFTLYDSLILPVYLTDIH